VNKKTKRIYIPGSEWVYFKIYTGIRIADRILCEILYPITMKMMNAKKIDKFFYIRYADPDFHIRIRLHLSNPQYLGEILSSFYKVLDPIVEKKLVWKIQLDTYQRELERYNSFFIEDVESLFCIDSIYIIKIIKQLTLGMEEDYRWMISMPILDNLLSDFGYTLHDKKDLISYISNSIKEELKAEHINTKILNKKYERYRQNIEFAFCQCKINKEYKKLLNIVYLQSRKMKPIINKIKKESDINQLNIQNYIASYIHMSMNRLFASENRLYELVIYDFLRRYYIHQISIDVKNININNIIK